MVTAAGWAAAAIVAMTTVSSKVPTVECGPALFAAMNTATPGIDSADEITRADACAKVARWRLGVALAIGLGATGVGYAAKRD